MGDSPNTVTRRQFLKRGAAVGATVAWVTPIVQTVGMQRAMAATTSPHCTIYCLVWHPSNPGAPSYWAVYEGDKCLPCPGESSGSLPGDIDEFTVEYDDVAETYTVTYPSSYSLLKPDPTPDDLIYGSAAFRHGEATNDCAFLTPDDEEPGTPPNTTQLVFDNAQGVPGERIELILGQDCS